MVKVCFFSSKSYVKDSFDKSNTNYGFNFVYHSSSISLDNISLSKGCDVICIFVNDYLDKDILQQLKYNGCKLIALRCAGFNNIDIESAKSLDIPVVRVPAYSPYAVAEHAFALILTLNRKIHKSYNRVRESNFDISGLLGYDLYNKTIGIIGTGKIGQIFINIANGFGMKIIAYDLYPNHNISKKLNFEYKDLDYIYKNSDIIALHCPLTPENKYMINQDTLQLMKNGVVIINTSRGGLIKTSDLIVNLKNDKIGAVGLDVYEEEEHYFFEDFSSHSGLQDDVLARLLSFNNVIVTSHQAFFTNEALDSIANTTLHNIKSYLINNKLINQVT